MPRPVPRPLSGRVESLEDRVTPAIAMALAGATATITGDAVSDTLVVTVDTATAGGPFLAHNRVTAGDAGFVSNLDFDSTLAGVQTLAATAASSLIISDLGDGDDALRIVRGSDGATGSGDVDATVGIDNLGGDAGDSITVDDSTRTTAATYTYNRVGVAFAGPGYNVSLNAFHSGGFFLTTGTGSDTVNVTGTFGNSQEVTLNSANGLDTVNIGAMSELSSTVTVNNTPSLTTVNIDSSADGAATYTLTAGQVTSSLAGAPVIFTPIDISVVNLTTGGAADVINVTATINQTNVTAGDGGDVVAFAAGATLSGGTLDGGAGTDTLDYTAYTTPVAVNLGLGVAGLTAALDGGQEVPSNGIAAAGTGTVSNYNALTRTFDLNLTVGGLAPAAVTGIHLHRGGLGANGPIVLDLLALGTLLPNGTGFTLALNGLDVDAFLLGGAANEAAFLGGQTYLNVHTAAFPNGAIRGQVFSTGNVALPSGTATGITSVTGVENATGGAAGDSLIGTTAANVLNGLGGNDVLLGGPGADTFLGGANDDTLIWSNGDGSDVMDGQAGNDTVAVNGNLTVADVFTVAANGSRVDFDRTSAGPFSLDIGTVETMRVAGVGGADTFTVSDLSTVANLQSVQLFGLAGTDTFEVTPSTVPVSVFGGGGTDTLNLGPTTGPTDPFVTPVADPAGGVTGSTTYTIPTPSSIFFSQIEPPPEPFNFLTVTATDGRTISVVGSTVTITVVVTNTSPVGIGGIGVSDLFPPELTGVTWTAAYTGNRSSGAASGSGDIAELVNLEAGGSVTYSVTARLRTDVAGSFTNTATATVPAGLVDGNTADNTATDSTTISAALPTALVVTGPGGGSGLRFASSGGQLVSPQTVAFFPGFLGEIHVAQGDVDDDGVPDIVAATGPGAGVFQVVRGSDGAAVTQIEPFPGYAGGLFVAVGDLTGDGKADIAVMPDAADAFTGPINRELPVRVYSGADFSLVAAFNGLADLQGASGENDGTKLGGRPAIADVNGDGTPDLLVAAGNGGGPRVTVWSGAGFPGAAGGKPTVNPLTNLFVFESTQRGGAFLTAGDVSGDGVADIIVGGGPGGGPRVRIVSGAKLFGLSNLDVNLDDPANLANGLVLNNFIAGDGNLRGGLRVAVADVDADGRADLVTGSGTGEGSSVRVYTGLALAAAFGTSSEPGVNQVLDPFAAVVPGGVWVG
ncbi:beta strand repeat-containing protein [Urbifossiella limnaea]|uniref:Serralysin C n=1 Tax=Urbifossiella limnaea TaxID=2528023 RepID=A0A517XXV0_9BACT|nr:CHRD domain-containing protein [Urbifossiella limnaea]QDU22324.1 Serralysin C precursor [Urbifossiella limnaea]